MEYNFISYLYKVEINIMINLRAYIIKKKNLLPIEIFNH